MTIPKAVETKIRYLQNKFPSTEWSGVLFYTYTGSFENNDLVITCQDIFPMDLGNSVFTEFCVNEEVTAYIAENMDTLWECETGLCHSHHFMGTQFSGTDISTLQSEGADRNNFVSLIVNNAGTYSAAITRKVQKSYKIQESNSYRLFGLDGDKNESKSYERKEEVIEYAYLDITVESADETLSFLDKRFEDIKKKKTPSIPADSPITLTASNHSPWVPSCPETVEANNKTVSTEKINPTAKPESSLFPEEEMLSLYKIDPATIKSITIKMLLCSLLSNTNKVNMKDFITKHMKNVYDHFFGDSEELKFTEYVDWVVDYMIAYSRPDEIEDDAAWTVSVAYEIRDLLLPYETVNPYVSGFIDTLTNYIDS